MTQVFRQTKFVFLFTLFISSIYAQNVPSDKQILSEARRDVALLCSNKFAGRGYTGNGHTIAAEFIARRFSNLGLLPVQAGVNPYFQSFSLNLNIIKDARMEIDGKAMEMGIDFIVSSGCPASEGRAAVEEAGYGLIADELNRETALLFTDGLPPEIAENPEKKEQYKALANTFGKLSVLADLDPDLLMVRKQKLTASFSAEQDGFPIVEYIADSLPENPEAVHWHLETTMENIETQNVLAKVVGAIQDTFVVISAHYDHLGKVGNAIFRGANDNASGVALLLSLAEYFAEHPPKYSLLFIAFGAEETGLNGSRYYVEKNALVPLSQMRFLLNLDLMGNGTEGIMAVGGVEHSTEFEKLVKINEEINAIPIVKSRKNAPNSDHYFFLMQGVRGFFVYTMGGPQWYHDVFDTPENLELSKYTGLRQLFIRFVEEM